MKFMLTAGLMTLSIGIWGSAHRILPLPRIPQTFEIYGNILALGFGTFVETLKLPDLTVTGHFGHFGEGPGEFIPEDKDMGLTLFLQPDTILVTSRNKISRFTYQGKHLNEFRLFHGFSHKPLSSGYIGLNTVARNSLIFHDITLFDQKGQIKGRLFSKRHWFQRNRDIDPIDVSIPRICVHDDLIFYQNATGNIEMTDHNGIKKATTEIDFELKAVSSKDREIYEHYYQSHPIYKEYYANLKAYIKFPDYFPAIKFFDVDDTRIYLFTYHRRDLKTRIYVCDFNGKLLKRFDLAMPEIDPFDVYPLARVSGGILYQIKEDGDDVVLWTTKILADSD